MVWESEYIMGIGRSGQTSIQECEGDIGKV